MLAGRTGGEPVSLCVPLPAFRGLGGLNSKIKQGVDRKASSCLTRLAVAGGLAGSGWLQRDRSPSGDGRRGHQEVRDGNGDQHGSWPCWSPHGLRRGQPQRWSLLGCSCSSVSRQPLAGSRRGSCEAGANTAASMSEGLAATWWEEWEKPRPYVVSAH